MHAEIYITIGILCLNIYLQVSSATATFAMTFSSSMSVVEYYLLKRFPVPYGTFSLFPSSAKPITAQEGGPSIKATRNWVLLFYLNLLKLTT